MKRAALYLRVSTLDQHPESQLYDLRHLATQRGFVIVNEYTDRGVSGTRARRPALDQLMATRATAASKSCSSGRRIGWRAPSNTSSTCSMN